MNRLLLATLGSLLLTTACTDTTEEPEKKECQLEAFDLSACDRSGLAAVTVEGVWHLNVVLEDTSETPGAMNLSADNGMLFGTPLTERQVGGDTFFLASDFQESGFAPTRFAIAGCQATAPDRVKGQFRRCSGGEMDLQGTFEAVRVSRQAGEAEASKLELKSELALPRGVAMDLFVANGYAYVTALTDGLFVFDVRNPEAPTKVAEVPARGDTWRQVWVKDQTLYIGSAVEGILVYDVSTPSSPKRLKALPNLGTAISVWGLYVDQDRLYAVSPLPRAEVFIYDVKTPTSPTLLSRYVVEDSLPDSGETPVEASVFADRLYIGHWRYGLAVADVTDPAKPTKLGRFAYDNATSRTVAVGSVGDRTVAFESSEGWGSSVRALDVTDPKNIKQLGVFTLRPESTVSGLRLVGSKLYVAHNQDGLRVLDVSDPNTLRQVGWYNTWRETDPGRGRFFLDGLGDVRVPGDGFIYATDTSRGLLIFRELP